MAPNETRRHSCSQHRPKPHLVSVHRSAGLGNARLWAVLRPSHSCGGAIALRATATAGIVQAVAGVGTVVLTRDGWDKAEFPRERELVPRAAPAAVLNHASRELSVEHLLDKTRKSVLLISYDRNPTGAWLAAGRGSEVHGCLFMFVIHTRR